MPEDPPSGSTRLRVMIVDDIPSVRALLRLTLRSSALFDVVAEAEDGREAIELAQACQPDVVLLDLAMPVLDGLAAIPDLRRAAPHARIVVLSGFSAARMRPVAVEAGADSYVEKSHHPAELLTRLTDELTCAPPPPSSPADGAQEPTRQAMERFRLAFDSAPIGMALTDLGGRFVMVNDAAVTMTGYSREDLLGTDIRSLAHPLDADPDATGQEEILAGRIASCQVEKRYVRADGSIGWALISRSLLRDGDGTPREWVVQAVDISTFKQTAEELARSNADLSDFASVAAHDLRSPLQTISGFADLLSRCYGDQLDDRGREFLDWILKGAANMADLVNDLLAYAKAGTDEQAAVPVDLNALVGQLRSTLGADPSTVEVADLPAVLGDPGQLGLVFQNLIVNALKFVPSDREPHIRVSAERAGGAVTVVVDDNGIGIAPPDYGRLFKMFERLHRGDGYEGTGIGLAICKRIVERAGGSIWVEPAPVPPGTRFCVSLPSAEVLVPQVPAIPPDAALGLSILLVEDSDDHARLVESMLAGTREQYRIRRVTSVAQAREAIAEEPVECVLLDLSLPDSEGLETVHRVRESAPGVAVVVLTSRDDESTAVAALQQGAQDFLVKGRLGADVLARAIRYAVERKLLERRLEEQALHDPLTSLANRTLVLDRLELASVRSVRTGDRVAVVFLDLDDFKSVNDRFGHEAGDAVLIEVARRIREVIRPSDTAGRLGGDEFVVVCEAMTGVAEVEELVNRISLALEAPIRLGTHAEQVRVSVGWAFAEPGQSPAVGLRMADEAMYRNKRLHQVGAATS